MTFTVTPATGGVTGKPINAITGLFVVFEKIAAHGVVSKPISAEFGVNGCFFRYERHFVYGRHLASDNIGIVTMLHEHMHQIERFRDDFGLV